MHLGRPLSKAHVHVPPPWRARQDAPAPFPTQRAPLSTRACAVAAGLVPLLRNRGVRAARATPSVAAWAACRHPNRRRAVAGGRVRCAQCPPAYQLALNNSPQPVLLSITDPTLGAYPDQLLLPTAPPESPVDVRSRGCVPRARRKTSSLSYQFPLAGAPSVVAVVCHSSVPCPSTFPHLLTMALSRPAHTVAAFAAGLPLGARSVIGQRLGTGARRATADIPSQPATSIRSVGGRRSARLMAFTEPPPPPASSSSSPTDAEPPLSLRPASESPVAPRRGSRGFRRWAWPTDQKLSFFDWHLVFGLFSVAVVERTTTALSSPSLLHSAQAAFVMAVTALVYRIRA